MKKIRCVLVHDHLLVRQGLRRLLEDEPDLEIVGEAGNASEALQQVFELRPNVVLADPATMGLPPEDAERLILRESPASRVFFLGLCEQGDRSLPGELAQSEAGYVPPHTSAEELVAMVTGRLGSLSSRVHEMPARSDGQWFPSDSPSSKKRGLTAREREVLKLLAEGQTVRSAAGVLGVSVKTVDAHKFNLMRKLGIHNKAELVMWAIQKRVVKVPVNY
ncbi:MAG TPA: response regulator transcription factor [Candidatus Sulfotelmatobacter sp.]